MNKIEPTAKLEYIAPKIQISNFQAADIICASNGAIELPMLPLFENSAPAAAANHEE